MTARDVFVADREARWKALEKLLARPWFRTAAEWSELSTGYRAVCADLARAQTLGLGDDVERYLDELAGRAHNRLYGTRGRVGLRLLRLVFVEFPQELRRNWVFFTLSTLLFYGPFVLGAIGASASQSFASNVLPEEALRGMEDAYGGTETVRSAGENAMMGGFYVWNNVGIAFRCFATGALAGLGSVFYLAYNGLVIGTVFGHVWRTGGGYNLITFTSGHSPWELTGIVVSGTAGLRLGYALVVTEGRTRVASVRAAAPSLYRLVAGAAALLLVAASIEGFWSASPIPAPVKWLFGLLGCVVVAAWLLFGGASRR